MMHQHKQSSFRYVLFVFLFSISSLCATAQLESSLLWKISGNGLEQPSYLFGTAHSARQEILKLDSTVLNLIGSCDVLTGELDLSGGMSSLEGMDFSTFMLKGKTLESLYDNPNDYEAVQEHIQEYLGGMASMMEHLKPFFIMITIEELAVKDTSDGDLVLDMYLQEYAVSQGLEIKGLETLQQQMELFDAIPLEEQAKLLLEQAREENMREERDKLIRLYLSQDIEELYKITQEESKDLSGFQDKFLDERNVHMADKIAILAKKYSVFNTFGAAHLAGEKGIINLLREKGFDVTPITIQY